MRIWTTAALTILGLAGATASVEAGCTRNVINRTPHLVSFSQNGGPAVMVSPRRSRPIRYDASGSLSVSVHCPTGAGPDADIASAPVFTERYDTVAVLDRCHVEIDGGGTQPVALNAPRPGDVAIAPYGVACPLPPRADTISSRF